VTLKLIAALAFVGLNFYAYHYFASDDFIPTRSTFASVPMAVGDWSCPQREAMDPEVIANLGVTDYLICNYTNEETRRTVGIYAGYHARQVRSESGGETVIHPPEHCLPGSGWDIIKSEIVPIDFGTPGEAKRVIIAKGNQRNLVYFWYQTHGRVIARNHEKLIYMFLDRAFDHRTDGSLIRFTVPIGPAGESVAEAAFYDLARQLVPVVSTHLPE
jgi:EpsI family protein